MKVTEVIATFYFLKSFWSVSTLQFRFRFTSICTRYDVKVHVEECSLHCLIESNNTTVSTKYILHSWQLNQYTESGFQLSVKQQNETNHDAKYNQHKQYNGKKQIQVTPMKEREIEFVQISYHFSHDWLSS